LRASPRQTRFLAPAHAARPAPAFALPAPAFARAHPRARTLSGGACNGRSARGSSAELISRSGLIFTVV